jgi:hypothetical protein
MPRRVCDAAFRIGWPPRVSRRNQFMIGAGSLLVAILALALDNLILLQPDEPPRVPRFLVLTLICAAIAAAIYLYVIPRAARATGPSNRLSQAGFVAGLTALAAVIVYWTALPFLLGAGGFVLGSLGEERARRDMERAPRDEEQADPEVDAEDADRAKDEEDVDEEEAPSVSERAGQAWAARVMGVLAAAACVLLFAVVRG